MIKLALCTALVGMGILLPVLWTAPPPRAAEPGGTPRHCAFAAGFTTQGQGGEFRDLASPVPRFGRVADC